MFPWNKVPRGNDDVFRVVAKVFFVVVGVGITAFGLFSLWVYLERKFESTQQTENTIQNVSGLFAELGNLLVSLLPALLFLLFFCPLVYFSGLWMVRYRYREEAKKNTQYLRLLPSIDVRLEIEKVINLSRTFGGMIRPFRSRIALGTPWFRLRFAIPNGSNEIGIYMAYPKDKKNSVIDTIKSVYPSAEIHLIEKEQFPQPEQGGSGGHFIFQLGKRQGLPLASLNQKKQSALGEILNCLRPGTFFDLQFAPVSWRKLEERTDDAFGNLKHKKMKEMDPEEKARRISLTQRLTGRERTFRVRISLWSNHSEATSIVRSLANSIETAMNYDGGIRFIKHDWWNSLLDPCPIPKYYPYTLMIWDCDEMANLFHLPPGDHWIYKEPKTTEQDARGYIVHLQSNQHSLDPEELNEGILIGKLKHPLTHRDVRISYGQLSKHFIITGASGMGKSSMTVEMLQSMLDDWLKDPTSKPGFTLIDPAREIISIIENRLRVSEELGIQFPKEKIHHFNLSDDTTHIPALNLLHKTANYPANQIAHQAAIVICSLSNPQELKHDTIRRLEMAIQSLLEDQRKHTILSVEDLFRNPQFRERVVQQVQDPYVKRFWKNFNETHKDVDQVLHRIDKLLQNPTTRRLFCQVEMSLEIRKYMDEGHLVFIDTFGLKDYQLRVTVGQILNQYYLEAKKRESGSKFHLLLVDETQDTQIPLLAQILSDDRKLDFSLGLITREIHQYRDEELLSAIRSNIGMIISCGQTEGASKVENLTRNHLKAAFLEKLPERTAAVYIRSKRNRRADIATCVVENKPPVVYKADGQMADHQTNEKEMAHGWGLDWGLAIMKESSEVRSIDEVDAEIFSYMT